MDKNKNHTRVCQQTLCQNAKVSLPITIRSYAKTDDIRVTCRSEPDLNEMSGDCSPTVTIYITMRVPIHTGTTIEVGEPFLHG